MGQIVDSVRRGGGGGGVELFVAKFVGGLRGSEHEKRARVLGSNPLDLPCAMHTLFHFCII